MEYLVRFAPSGRSLRVAEGTDLLEAARRAGLPVASSCGANGVCCRCGLEILEGAEDLPPESPREAQLKARNRIDSGLRLGCYTKVVCDLVVTTPYW